LRISVTRAYSTPSRSSDPRLSKCGAATERPAPPTHLHLRTELVHAQRDKLNDLYRRGKISDEIRRSLAGTLDQQERGRL